MENDWLKFENGERTIKNEDGTEKDGIPLDVGKKTMGALAVFVYELFGTAMLVFAVNMIANQPVPSFWGIPLTLFGTLCWAGPVTGGHMNPAVSLAVLIQHIDKLSENIILFFVMVLAQFIGGLLGLGFFITVNHGASYLTNPLNIAQLKPTSNENFTVTAGGAFQVELICTYMFILTIMQHKGGRLQSTLTTDGMLMKATVALALMAAILVGGGYTGGCFNPSVGNAQSVICSWGPKTNCYDYYWVYMLAPTLGGALAGCTALIMKPIGDNFTVKKGD